MQSKIDLKEPTIPTTLQEEIETNIFLRYDDKKIKKSMGIDYASNIEVFKKLRNLKDQF